MTRFAGALNIFFQAIVVFLLNTLRYFRKKINF